MDENQNKQDKQGNQDNLDSQGSQASHDNLDSQDNLGSQDNQDSQISRDQDSELVPEESDDSLDNLKKAAGKAALATVLAGSITTGAAAITPDKVVLPEATPIVQVYDDGSGVDLPDSVSDDEQKSKSSILKKILQILKYALIALFFLAALIFGLLQGCAACAGNLGAPVDNDQQESSVTSSAA